MYIWGWFSFGKAKRYKRAYFLRNRNIGVRRTRSTHTHQKKSIHTTYCTKYPAYILAYDFPTFSISRLCSLSIYLCLSELFTSSTDYWVYTCFDNIMVTYKYIEKCKKNTRKKRIFNIYLSYIINYPDFTIGNKHFFLLFFPSAALRIHWLFAGFWAPFMYPHACFIIFPVPDKRWAKNFQWDNRFLLEYGHNFLQFFSLSLLLFLFW